jgi:hypothetical protein
MDSSSPSSCRRESMARHTFTCARLGGELIVELSPVRVVVGAMPTATARAAVRLVEAHQITLMTEWTRIHG